MVELDKKDPVSLTELMISTLAMADAVAKLLSEKGVISQGKTNPNARQHRTSLAYLARVCRSVLSANC
jgi:hypothetical protein